MRPGKHHFGAVALVVIVAAANVVGSAVAAAAATCAPLMSVDQNYTATFGVALKVPAPGLLAGDAGSTMTIETSWQADPAGFPSDDLSFLGNATIRYGTPGAGLNRSGGFTYTPDPDPNDAFSGEDSFDFTVTDRCGDENFQTANVTVVPVVVDSSYTTAQDTPLSVPAATGFLAKDRGVDPSTLDYDATSAHGASIDDSLASDGSFVYTPAPGFFGADSFGYTVDTLDGSDTYAATVHINVIGAPAAPTGVVAKLSGNSATVNWTTPSAHGSAIKSYTMTASPGGRTVTGSAKPLTIKGLAKGVTYTFRVRARNALGTGPESGVSNAVTVVSSQSVARTGYWMLSSNGQVYPFGDAGRYQHVFGTRVAIAPRRDGTGYWTVDAVGRVSHFGAARAFGDHPALRAGEVVSTISATPSGNGYWLFTNRGRAFAYGDAKFKGDLTGSVLNGPIVASVATPTGNGYFMVGSDGGVFSFGDARFHGSTGGIHLNRPIVGISPTASNSGYWLVASDGGVFAFNAPFRGSMGGASLSRPVNGLVGYGNGYLMVASDGGVFDFSSTPFLGSLASNPPPAPIIGIGAFTTA